VPNVEARRIWESTVGIASSNATSLDSMYAEFIQEDPYAKIKLEVEGFLIEAGKLYDMLAHGQIDTMTEYAKMYADIVAEIFKARDMAFSFTVSCEEARRVADRGDTKEKSRERIIYYIHRYLSEKGIEDPNHFITTIERKLAKRVKKKTGMFRCARCKKSFEIGHDRRYYGHKTRKISFCSNCWNTKGSLYENKIRMDNRRNGLAVNTSERAYDTKFKDLASKRFYGIELELDGYKEKVDIRNVIDNVCSNTIFSAVHDGSINSTYGREFVSPKLRGDEGLKDIRKFLGYVQGAKPSKATGYHLHIGIPDFTVYDLTNLLRTYAKLERYVIGTLPASRRRNTYCKRLSSAEMKDVMAKYLNKQQFIRKFYGTGWSDDSPTQHEQIRGIVSSHYDHRRYYGVNIHTYFYRRTVEIRYHNGTSDYNKIVHWIKLHTAIVDCIGSKGIGEIERKLRRSVRGFLEWAGVPARTLRFYKQRQDKFKDLSADDPDENSYRSYTDGRNDDGEEDDCGNCGNAMDNCECCSSCGTSDCSYCTECHNDGCECSCGQEE